MIDLQLLQVEKGGNPELVRESQRKRFASESLVDEVLSMYKHWTSLESVSYTHLTLPTKA